MLFGLLVCTAVCFYITIENNKVRAAEAAQENER